MENKLSPANPTDHELERVLARVAGVNPEPTWDADVGWITWNPLHDANQMERVKKSLGLRSYAITISRGKSHVQINNNHPQMGSPNVWIAEHPDELRAFALAVWEMERDKPTT